MIYCKPKTLFSWDYDVEGDGLEAFLTHDWIREQGALQVNGVDYEVNKNGFTSGMWTMERRGVKHAVAQKIRAATRRFEMQSPSGLLTMRPMSPFKRSFLLERSDEIVGTIQANHPFTRKATIDLSPREEDVPAVCFAFWLAILTWKRRRRAAS